MRVQRAKKDIAKLFEQADVRIDGDRPWDIQVKDDRLYKRLLKGGSLALGESYMDNWWEAQKIDELINRLFRVKVDNNFKYTFYNLRLFIESALVNAQSSIRSKEVVEKHYDLDNDLFMSFLDPYNQYTCGYFKETDDLNEAQKEKLDLICKKLCLQVGDKVLDIGCGWGGFMKFAVENYGCQVTGVSISEEQLKYARDFCKGLDVQFLKLDYRDLPEKNQYDKILVCGMIEHVGYKNHRTLVEKVSNCLNENGLFLLHTIGSPLSVNYIEPWIAKYIFPNAVLPSMKQISEATEGLFVTEDVHNFGHHYYRTLRAWHDNFKENWEEIKHKYDGRFFRMWEFYLLSCAGSFLARKNQLWQFVFSKNGQKGGYVSVR